VPGTIDGETVLVLVAVEAAPPEVHCGAGVSVTEGDTECEEAKPAGEGEHERDNDSVENPVIGREAEGEADVLWDPDTDRDGDGEADSDGTTYITVQLLKSIALVASVTILYVCTVLPKHISLVKSNEAP
jgi:hypothetical protein